MDVEIVHPQMDGAGSGVRAHHALDHPGKLGGGPVRGGTRQIAPLFGFDDRENRGGPPPPVFVIPFGEGTGACRARRPHFGLEEERLFVQTDHRFLPVVGCLRECQDILHPRDVLCVPLSDTPPFFPPRLHVVGLPEDPDRLASHPRH